MWRALFWIDFDLFIYFFSMECAKFVRLINTAHTHACTHTRQMREQKNNVITKIFERKRILAYCVVHWQCAVLLYKE